MFPKEVIEKVRPQVNFLPHVDKIRTQPIENADLPTVHDHGVAPSSTRYELKDPCGDLGFTTLCSATQQIRNAGMSVATMGSVPRS